jgi:L-ascorbate metabolism protein UlaG (beta-lactamase superfamily)
MATGLYERVFDRFVPNPAQSPRGRGPRALVIRWLGTAGYVIKTETTTVLLDPFVSRQSLLDVAFLPLDVSDAAIEKHIPDKVDAVLCGHSHYDHILDAPRIARKTGALLVGSVSTCAWGRREGVEADKLVTVPPEGHSLSVGDIQVRFVPSVHGKVKIGPFKVPQLPGQVLLAPQKTPRAFHYKMGGAYGIHLQCAGVGIYHNGSADLIDTELSGVSADVLLCGLAGRRATRDYTKRLIERLAPKLVLPSHHDAFFAPLERGCFLLPGIDLLGFEREVRDASKAARLLTPDYLEDVVVPPDDPRDAFLFD